MILRSPGGRPEMAWIPGIGLAFLVLLTLGVVALFIMVFWPRRAPFHDAPLSPETYRAREIANGVVFDGPYQVRQRRFALRDGGWITARQTGPDAADDVILLVHGIAAAGKRWVNPAGLMSEASGARVIAVDLRGHGGSSGARYHVDRIGQYEDDIAEVIEQLRLDAPTVRVWLAGHSMGGGIVLRYALKPGHPAVAGYILLAPVFGPGPTAPAAPVPDAPLWIDQARITALILLNRARIRQLNHLSVAQVNAPPEYPAYSFAALASGLPLPPATPADALGAMERPFLIVAGIDDAVIRAEGYREVAGDLPHGRIELLSGLGHDNLLNAAETHRIIASWIETFRSDAPVGCLQKSEAQNLT